MRLLCVGIREESRERQASFLQRPGTEHFVLPKCFQCARGNGRHGKCTSEGGKDFDGVAFGPIRRRMMINEFDNISSTEPMLW